MHSNPNQKRQQLVVSINRAKALQVYSVLMKLTKRLVILSEFRCNLKTIRGDKVHLNRTNKAAKVRPIVSGYAWAYRVHSRSAF